MYGVATTVNDGWVLHDARDVGGWVGTLGDLCARGPDAGTVTYGYPGPVFFLAASTMKVVYCEKEW